ncbi:hypothetical protein [Rufibacter immobilis]|uniref:hypothetical protein n=1 Tax=Rufibacter immobilis TaxID=1348778 RepID=UPI0035EBCD1E
MKETTDNRRTAFRVDCGDSTKKELDRWGKLPSDAIVTYTKTITAIDGDDSLIIKKTTEHDPEMVSGDSLQWCNGYSGGEAIDGDRSDNLSFFTIAYLVKGEENLHLHVTFDIVKKVYVSVYAIKIFTIHEYRKAAIKSFLSEIT